MVLCNFSCGSCYTPCNFLLQKCSVHFQNLVLFFFLIVINRWIGYSVTTWLPKNEIREPLLKRPLRIQPNKKDWPVSTHPCKLQRHDGVVIKRNDGTTSDRLTVHINDPYKGHVSLSRLFFIQTSYTTVGSNVRQRHRPAGGGLLTFRRHNRSPSKSIKKRKSIPSSDIHFALGSHFLALTVHI